MISIDSTLNNQLSTINCFNEERHMSERVFYRDTNDVSSTSKVVALSIARDRTREMIFPIHAFLSRHSFSTTVALCEGWLASAEALYERQINGETKRPEAVDKTR